MRKGEPIAGLGGLALFAALFLDWYVSDPSPPPPETGNLAEPLVVVYLYGDVIDDPAPNAWNLFAVTDVALLLFAALALAVPLVSLLTKGPAKSIGTAVLAGAFGWIAIVLVLWKIVFPPFDEIAASTGAWVALAAATVAWAGSWLSLRDESTPGAVEPLVPRFPVP